MLVKTIIASDMRAALAAVREEVGEDAVIVASESAKGGGVLVRAAREDVISGGDTGSEFDRRDLPANFEVHCRQRLLGRLRGGRPVAAAPRSFSRAALLAILGAHRVADHLAHELAEAAESTSLSDMTYALAAALDKRMRIRTLDFGAAGALLVAGPPGVGKTAVAAKIAARAQCEDRLVTLIAADAAGAGAAARLNAFAAHLGVSCTVCEAAEALARHVREALTERRLAIIDTAGFDPREPKARAAFAALARIPDVEALGVIAAAGDAEETAEIVRGLRSAGVQRMVVTGLDLARRAGGLLAAAVESGELAHVTRSPFVGSGLDALTSLSLARLLVEAEPGATALR